MGNIYSAPESDLTENLPSSRLGGNVEDAVAGNISIGMIETLGAAWDATKGFKLSCHFGLLLYLLVYLVAIALVGAATFALTLATDQLTASIVWQVVQMLLFAVVLPIAVGIHILGIRHAAGVPINGTRVLRHFNKLLPLMFCYILTTILMILGFVLLVLPGIYLIVAYWYANALIVEKNMSIWEAMETSRKAISKKWFPFFGLLMLLWLINALGVLTLTISWIWTIPWSILTLSMVYAKLFGAEAQTLVD